MKNEPFVIEGVFNAPVEKVWRAITDKQQMKEWYFDMKDFAAIPGTEFDFYGGSEENRYLHLCKIIEVVNEKKLAYSWRYDGYEGDSLVTFELFPEGENTRVRLTHAGLETLPASNPDFKQENFAAGWTEIIGSSLKEFVEAPTVSPPQESV